MSTARKVDPVLLSRCELPLRVSRFGSRPGTAPSKRPGIGWEINSSREYVFGDDPRKVDWNATARTGALHVRTNLADVAVTVHLVAYQGVTMAFGPSRSKEVTAREALGFVAALAAARGHRCNLYTVDGAKILLPARSPEGALDERLLAGRGSDDRDRYLSRLSALPAPSAPSLLVTTADLSCLVGMTRMFTERPVDRDLLVLFVYDPFEVDPPAAGSLALADPEGKVSSRRLDTRTRALYRSTIAERLKGFAAEVTAAGGSFLAVSTEGDVHAQMVARLGQGRNQVGYVPVP